MNIQKSWRVYFFDVCMVAFFLLIAVIYITSFAYGIEPTPEAKAKAALALAKSARERVGPVRALIVEKSDVKPVELVCFEDYSKARAIALKEGKPLVLWVNLTCEEHPGLRRSLGEAIHCWMPDRGGDASPRIIVQGGDDITYTIRAERLSERTPEIVKSVWARMADTDCIDGRCPRKD